MRRNSDKRMLMRITINKLMRMRINSDKCSDNENHSHMQVRMRIILIGSTLVLQIPAKNLRIDICPINRPPASPPAFKPNPRRSPTLSKPEARKSPTLISQLQSPQPVPCFSPPPPHVPPPPRRSTEIQRLPQASATAAAKHTIRHQRYGSD